MAAQSRSYNSSTVLVLTIVLGLFASGLPSAVLGAPPYKKNCTQDDVYERLECRQAALADQLQYTSEEVFAEGTKLHQRIKPARRTHIKNAKEKLLRSKKKNTKETFKRQAKAETQGNKKGGHLIPLVDFSDDVNNDGICDYEQGEEFANAKCAAIELDESGNLQACNPKKQNKGKGKGKAGGNLKFEGLECDLFFDSIEASTPSEEEEMEEFAEQLDATYSATEDDIIEMNEHLDVVNENLPLEPAAMLTTENSCDLPELTPGLADAAFVMREVHASLFGAARIAADFGGQTFVAFGFGGNTKYIAVAFDSIALVANIAYITVDELHKSESGELQSAIMNCVNQTAGETATLLNEIKELQAQIQLEHKQIKDNDNENTATIVTEVDEARVEVIGLLYTPQGQRTDFPLK